MKRCWVPDLSGHAARQSLVVVAQILPIVVLGMCLVGCAPRSSSSPQAKNIPSPLPAGQVTPEASLSPTPSPVATPTPTATATATLSPTPSFTVTPSPAPTAVILRGTVTVARLSCRYGPGAMYLYLYALRAGAVQEVIGRTDTGNWVLTRAKGSQTVCWVNARYLTLNGDVMMLEVVYPDKYQLPVSPYYAPPYHVRATRAGDTVTITWDAQPLRAGDEEDPQSPRFVVETWVCRDGRILFTPLAAYYPVVSVIDEPGCAEPSHGRVFLAEKHGYAGPAEIPWP